MEGVAIQKIAGCLEVAILAARAPAAAKLAAAGADASAAAAEAAAAGASAAATQSGSCRGIKHQLTRER
jgi:hypothetical protein